MPFGASASFSKAAVRDPGPRALSMLGYWAGVQGGSKPSPRLDTPKDKAARTWLYASIIRRTYVQAVDLFAPIRPSCRALALDPLLGQRRVTYLFDGQLQLQ